MNLVNPYSLLGVNVNSTINELKKNYYNLALICHPDKGGSAEDMITLKNAYNYIKPQLLNKTEKSYEDLEDEFKDFCKNQTQKISSFSEVYAESHDWINDFNKKFEQLDNNDVFSKGYGNLMENKKNNNLKYNDIENGKIENNFSRELIIFKEPNSNPMDFGTNYRFDVKEIKDFSSNENINMNDYINAFSKPDDVSLFNENKNIDIDIDLEFNKRRDLYK